MTNNWNIANLVLTKFIFTLELYRPGSDSILEFSVVSVQYNSVGVVSVVLTEFVSVVCVCVQFWSQKPWSQQYQPGYYWDSSSKGLVADTENPPLATERHSTPRYDLYFFF